MRRYYAARAFLQECRSIHDDADRAMQNALARLMNNGLYRDASEYGLRESRLDTRLTD